MLYYELLQEYKRLRLNTNYQDVFRVPSLNEMLNNDIEDLRVCDVYHTLMSFNPTIKELHLSILSRSISWYIDIPWKKSYIKNKEDVNNLIDLLNRELILIPYKDMDMVKVEVIKENNIFKKKGIYTRPYWGYLMDKKRYPNIIRLVTNKTLEAMPMKEVRSRGYYRDLQRRKFRENPLHIKNEGRIPYGDVKEKKYKIVSVIFTDASYGDTRYILKVPKRHFLNRRTFVRLRNNRVPAQWIFEDANLSREDIVNISIINAPWRVKFFPSQKWKKQRSNRKWHKKHHTAKHYVKEDDLNKKICLHNKATNETVRIWKYELLEHDSKYSLDTNWHYCSKSFYKSQTVIASPINKRSEKNQKTYDYRLRLEMERAKRHDLKVKEIQYNLTIRKNGQTIQGTSPQT
jgi:hypothetical protein